jgi:hypothetical protein
MLSKMATFLEGSDVNVSLKRELIPFHCFKQVNKSSREKSKAHTEGKLPKTNPPGVVTVRIKEQMRFGMRYASSTMKKGIKNR